MTQLIFATHCILVFGIPPLFGWILLRRAFGEASLLTLIPGAVLVGNVALMALMNELRFAFEMNLAVWFSYKLLLALSLLLVVARRPVRFRPLLPRSASRAWQLAIVGAGGALVTLYFGIPAFRGYLNDAWWYHYPAAVQIQNVERFPLNHVFALDGPLYYHYGPDLLAATWSFLLEIPVQKAWALYVAILAPCSFLLAFSLLARLSRNFWAALIGAAILVAGGNLRFLLLLHGVSSPIEALQVFNSQTVQGLLQLMFTPSHAMGVPLVLLLVLLFRHLVARPSWLSCGIFGLLLGTLTLVAEWYFLPLAAGVAAILIARAWRRRTAIGSSVRLAQAALPLLVASAWGIYNNTYLSGMFGHFWMRYPNMEATALARQLAGTAGAERARTAPGVPSTGLQSLPPGRGAGAGSAQQEFDVLEPEVGLSPPSYTPRWTAPDLVPLRLNLHHFGQVPSWESAASNSESFIPILGAKFLLESTPVLLVGFGFALLLVWRGGSAVVNLLAWLALASAIPPILLDWGYRSTDFLRFFTASYSFAALFTGWLAGIAIVRHTGWRRAIGVSLAFACLASPIGLGVIGLLPGTIGKVKSIASSAQSLSNAAASEGPGGSAAGPAVAADSSTSQPYRTAALETLGTRLGDALFPITHGRDRAIVIVPLSEIPEVKYFPEWMKLATLARVLLPVGWHWQDSAYSAYYRDAASRLDPRAILSLDAKWVIVSNLFQQSIPRPVAEALRDRERFTPVATVSEGPFFMTAYRINR